MMHSPPPPPPLQIPRPATQRVESNPDLPTMADLDRLQSQLDTIDQTLADLNLTNV